MKTIGNKTIHNLDDQEVVYANYLRGILVGEWIPFLIHQLRQIWIILINLIGEDNSKDQIRLFNWEFGLPHVTIEGQSMDHSSSRRKECLKIGSKTTKRGGSKCTLHGESNFFWRFLGLLDKCIPSSLVSII